MHFLYFFLFFFFFFTITEIHFIVTAAIVGQNHQKIIVLQMGDERVVLAEQYFTAGTNHYHFPDHALSGKSPPYSLNLSYGCQL